MVLFSSRLWISSSKNFILLFKLSTSVISFSGASIFIGIPGKPAPVPMSIIFWLFCRCFSIVAESMKCFWMISSGFVMAVRLIFWFHSSSCCMYV